MFWFVYNNKEWAPDASEVQKTFGDKAPVNLVGRFQSVADHPLYAILYAVEGLRVFDYGLIEVDSDREGDIPDAFLKNADNKFAEIFGPFSLGDAQTSLARLQKYNLNKSTIEEVLSMVSTIQGTRQKLAATGNLDKWRDDMETMASTLGNIIEDLQFSSRHSLDHIIEPLKPRLSKS